MEQSQGGSLNPDVAEEWRSWVSGDALAMVTTLGTPIAWINNATPSELIGLVQEWVRRQVDDREPFAVLQIEDLALTPEYRAFRFHRQRERDVRAAMYREDRRQAVVRTAERIVARGTVVFVAGWLIWRSARRLAHLRKEQRWPDRSD